METVSQQKLKVAINGFGRIGRNFLRCWNGRENTLLDVVAINDSGGVKQVRGRWTAGCSGPACRAVTPCHSDQALLHACSMCPLVVHAVVRSRKSAGGHA